MSELIGLSVSTIRKLERTGILPPAITQGRTKRWLKSEVESYMKKKLQGRKEWLGEWFYGGH